tara:strand:+ start:101 stop:481 length:381 start_codon:yes stop_codon:yes gene_type:complete
MHYFFPGMAIGIILFQTAIIAPSLFKKLDKDAFGTVIRALWPKFFVLVGFIGLGTLVTLYFHDHSSMTQYAIAGSTALFSLICYAIIPATNRATDEGNEKRFNILHKLSVYLTIMILISNIAFLFL